MSSYDVFISYSRSDYVDSQGVEIPGNMVSRIKKFLEDHGYTYWFDEDGIYSGNDFVTVIADAIDQSRIFLFLSTKASNESKWTCNEIATAKHLDKIIIPFRVDNSKYSNAVLMYLAPLDYIDYANKPKKAFDALSESIQHHLRTLEEIEIQREYEKERLERERVEKQREIDRQAELLRKEQEKRLRIAQIDEQINISKARVGNKEAELDSVRTTIDELENRIKSQKAAENRIQLEIDELNHGIFSLEREKNVLCGNEPVVSVDNHMQWGAVVKRWVKTFKDNIQKRIHKFLHKQNIKDVSSSTPKRYWIHRLFIIALVFFCILVSVFLALEEDKYYLLCGSIFSLCGIVAIRGLHLLFLRKQLGIYYLLLNTILVWYAVLLFGVLRYVAYVLLVLYLAFPLLIFLLHKTDQLSHLSWDKMAVPKVKRPLMKTLIFSLGMVILSYLLPFSYAYFSGIETYDQGKADRYMRLSLHYYMTKDVWNARHIGDLYSHENEWNFLLKKDMEKALKWYMNGEDEDNVRKCSEYLSAKKNGFYRDSVYGRCGIDPYSDEVVKINLKCYNGKPLDIDSKYMINLYGASPEGSLSVKGASYVEGVLSHVNADSVIITYSVGDTIISERVLPVWHKTYQGKIFRSQRQYQNQVDYNSLSSDWQRILWGKIQEESNRKYIIKTDKLSDIGISSSVLRSIIKDLERREFKYRLFKDVDNWEYRLLNDLRICELIEKLEALWKKYA